MVPSATDSEVTRRRTVLASWTRRLDSAISLASWRSGLMVNSSTSRTGYIWLTEIIGTLPLPSLPVDIGAEGTDLHEGDVQAHLAEPDDAGGDDGREVPGQQDDAGTPQRLLREIRGMGLELGERLVGGHGGLPPRLEPGEVVGQGLGEGPAGHGGVLDRRDLGVGCPPALELGDDEAAVRAQPEHRDPVPARAGRRRQALELEGDDLDGGSEDGRVGEDPLLEIGAFFEARFLERDHLGRHGNGAGHGEEHFFRHVSIQDRSNGR